MPARPLQFSTPAVRVRVQAPAAAGPAFATALRTFPPGAPGEKVDVTVVVEEAGGGWRATEDDGTVHDRPTLPQLTSALVSRLNELHLERDPSHTHLHAAGLTGDGGAVLLVGHSGAGKSTLAAHLLGRGLAYLSDEMVGVGPDGRVGGYPKPLTLKYGSRQLADGVRAELGLHTDPEEGQRWEVPADALGRLAGPGPQPVALVVLPVWDDRAPLSPSVEALAPPEALVALGANAMDLDRAPTRALSALGRVATAPTYRVRHRDADAVAAWVLTELADDRAGPRPEVEVVAPPPAPPAGLHRTTPGVLFDDRAVVWDPGGSRLVVLNPEGTELWRSLGDGSPPPAPDLETTRFLRLLAREGLVAGPLP